MALVNQVEKRVIMSIKDVIKFQIITHAYINKLNLSNADLDCLTLLAQEGSVELTHFCFDASEEFGIFKSTQTVRNCINKCEKYNIVIKDDINKKIIKVNPNLNIQTVGSILLDYKFLGK
jgi:hypothetical protein